MTGRGVGGDRGPKMKLFQMLVDILRRAIGAAESVVEAESRLRDRRDRMGVDMAFMVAW